MQPPARTASENGAGKGQPIRLQHKYDMKPTAILLLHCQDKPGIITEVTKFITDNKGNIVYLDQYVDHEDGMFFMRIEWELASFLIPRDKIREYVDTLYAQRYEMTFNLYFNDERPRMAWPTNSAYRTTYGA